MREIDASRESLESFVSSLGIPLSNIEYRRVNAVNDVTQVGLFGSSDNVKVEKVTKAKRKKKRDVPTYAGWVSS